MADRSKAGLSRRDVLRVGVLLMPLIVVAPRDPMLTKGWCSLYAYEPR